MAKWTSVKCTISSAKGVIQILLKTSKRESNPISSHIRSQTVRLHVTLLLSLSVTSSHQSTGSHLALQAAILLPKTRPTLFQNPVSSIIKPPVLYASILPWSTKVIRFYIAHMSHSGPAWKEIISKNSYYMLLATQNLLTG